MDESNYLILNENGCPWDTIEKTLENENSAEVFNSLEDAKKKAIENSYDDSLWGIYECKNNKVEDAIALIWYRETFNKQ